VGTRVCAWCQAALGPAPDLAPGLISHGICPQCEVQFLEDAGITTSTALVRRAIHALEATLTASFTAVYPERAAALRDVMDDLWRALAQLEHTKEMPTDVPA